LVADPDRRCALGHRPPRAPPAVLVAASGRGPDPVDVGVHLVVLGGGDCPGGAGGEADRDAGAAAGDADPAHREATALDLQLVEDRRDVVADLGTAPEERTARGRALG